MQASNVFSVTLVATRRWAAAHKVRLLCSASGALTAESAFCVAFHRWCRRVASLRAMPERRRMSETSSGDLRPLELRWAPPSDRARCRVRGRERADPVRHRGEQAVRDARRDRERTSTIVDHPREIARLLNSVTAELVGFGAIQSWARSWCSSGPLGVTWKNCDHGIERAMWHRRELLVRYD
jgi:hypothetical protein